MSPAAAEAASLEAQARELAWSSVQGWLADPAVVDRLRDQNVAHQTLSPEQIQTLDQQWRGELKQDQAQRSLINRVLARPLSTFLRAKAEASDGLVRELFVMDAKGLLAGSSRITSDYWQGDEDKWIRPFREGAEVHLGEVTRDESTQTYLLQVSFPIIEPGATRPIGAVTVGINVEKLGKSAAVD
jgi:hypothetical protein